jgi:MHS family proline/betaine transporter-like MFS transporter
MPYWRVIAAASVGNALEWFDFTLYGFFAVTMGSVFFPAADGRTRLLLAFATFGVPFIVRPIGAWILGRFGDRHGRKSGLVRTIVLMIVATAMMALTPPYSAIGLAAPAIVLLARVLQGFSAGGEFGNATVFLAEQHGGRRGFLASWQFAGQAFSAFLVSGFGLTLNLTLTAGQLLEWGWRIPFLFGLLIGPVGYFVRRNAQETLEFQAIEPTKISVRQILTEAKNRLLMSFGLVVLLTVSAYTILLLPTYAASELGVPLAQAYLASLITGAAQTVLIPVFGALSDKLGRLRIMGVAAAGILIIAYPMFWLLAEIANFGPC